MDSPRETTIDPVTPNTAEPSPAPSWRRLFRRWLPGWVTEPATWIIAAACTAGVALLVGVVALVWWILSSVFDLLAGFAQAAGRTVLGPLARTVSDPLHAYLDTHAQGLPITATTLWWTWLVATVVLFIAAFSETRGGRIGWILIGALTTAMVWSGAPATGREVAAGLVVVAWALLSVPAFSGGHDHLERIRVVVLRDRTDDDTAVEPD